MQDIAALITDAMSLSGMIISFTCSMMAMSLRTTSNTGRTAHYDVYEALGAADVRPFLPRKEHPMNGTLDLGLSQVGQDVRIVWQKKAVAASRDADGVLHQHVFRDPF